VELLLGTAQPEPNGRLRLVVLAVKPFQQLLTMSSLMEVLALAR
jgi:hypothetical protein